MTKPAPATLARNPASVTTSASGKLRGTLVLSVLLGIVVFAALSLYADTDATLQAFRTFRWGYLPLALGLALANYLLRAGRWEYYLRRIGVHLPLRESVLIFLAGLSMSVTPGKVGEVFKSYLLKRTDGTEIGRSVSVIFAERLTDLLGVLILAALSFSAFHYGAWVLLAALGAVLAMLAVIQSKRACEKLLGLCQHLPLLKRLAGSLRLAYEAAYELLRPRPLLIATGVSAVAWFAECLAFYFVLQGFGQATSLPLATFIYAFASLAGAVSMIPGGLGVAEGSLTGLLVLSGVAKGDAASATIIVRLCTLWFAVLIGLAASLKLKDRM